jgi:hypothetical protein
MNGEWLCECELYVGNLLMEFLTACGPDNKSLHSVPLYRSDLNEAGTGVLVSSLLEVNGAHITGTSASTTSGEGMVKWELCLTLVFVVVTAVLLKASLPWQLPVTIWAYKPEAANTVYSS